MKRISVLFLINVLFAFILVQTIYAQQYQIIPVTGFNQDLIAEGSGGTHRAMNTTTVSFDQNQTGGGNHVMYAMNFRGDHNPSTAPPYGLVNTGFVVSANNSNIRYQLANFTGNNAVFLKDLNQSGALTFGASGSYSALSILASSAEGSSTFTIRVNFSDATYTDYTFNVPDWYGGTGYAIQGIGRVQRVTDGTDDYDEFDGDASNPRLYDCNLTISATDKVKLITGISITKTSSGGRTAILAVSGQISTTVPGTPTANTASNVQTTSFTANWTAVDNTTSYKLDVSTSESFSTFVTGYNNLDVGNVTTKSVTGLTAGIQYFYRVRAANANGQSFNSNTISVGGLSGPVATDATSKTSTSFYANWGSVTGATSYRLDVATDFYFQSIVSGYNNLNVSNVTTYSVTGLTSGVTYYYRVRAVNASFTSMSSNIVSTGLPVPPVLTYATNVQGTSFTANWAFVTATSYKLDVSTSSTFSTFVTGYNNLDVGNVNSVNVTGLTAGVTYYYRIRSVNSSGSSVNSNVVTVTTINYVIKVTASAGTSGPTNYATLKAAFDAINAGTHMGNISVQICASTTETATAVLNGSNPVFTLAANYTSVVIYSAVSGLSITGSLAAPLIDLNGADNVTIDGRLNQTGTEKDLVITNTSTSSTTGTSTIRMYNGANNNTIKYCTVKGSSLDASGGVIFLGGSAASTGNTIDNNNITNAADANRPINAVYSGGAANTVTISNNNIYNFLSRSSSSNGVNLNTSTAASTISGNSFYETNTFAPTGNRAYYYPIYINSTVAGFTVSGNYIGGNAPLCTGTFTKTNAAYSNLTAININSVGTGTPSVVKGNLVNNIIWNNNNNDRTWLFGIAVNAGDVNLGASGEPNTIGSITGTPNMSFTFDNNGSFFVPICLNGSGYINCQYNNIGGITCNNSNPAECTRLSCIYRGNSNVSGIISNNTIGSSTNPISLTSPSNNDNQYLTGIYNTGSATTGLTISNNTISYLNNGATNTGFSYVSGILNYDSPAALTITNNTIHDLTTANVCGGGGRDASIRGGIWITTGYQLIVNNNTVYNLSNNYSTFNGYMYGIYAVGGGSVTNECSDNKVYNITATGTSAGPFIYGIYFGAGSASTNTVNRNYIYGLSSSGVTGNSWNTRYHGIYRQNSSNNITFANNIISLGGNNMSTIYGIYNEGNATGYSTNLYFNTVYISGSPTSGGLHSTVVYNPGNDTRTYKNNIFYNARSNNGASGNNYGLYHGSSIAATSDYNDIYASGSGGYIGYYNGNYCTTMSAWRNATSGDANSLSINPIFTNAGGTSATDYKPSTALYGAGGTGITTDYVGTTRSTTSPVMGAWEVAVTPLAPVLLTPLNGSTGNALPLNLVWNKLTGATKYNTVIATDSLFTNIVVNDTTLTDTVKTVSGLSSLTKFYWKVRAKNAVGWGSYSTAFNFKTLGTASQVILSSPVNGATNQPVSLTFKWFKAADLTFTKNINDNSNNTIDGPEVLPFTYWYELATDSLFTTVVARDSSLTDTTKTVTALSYGANYFWRVKAKNATGWGLYSSVWKLTTINPTPSAPTLLSPANGVTAQVLNLNLIWSKPQYATGYNVVLATDAGFTSIILNDSTLTDSVKILTNLTPLTTYYWKVRAKSIAGWGSFSTSFNFKTIGVPGQVILSTPVNNATGQPVNSTFKWFKAFDQTDGPEAISMTYWYELATDAGFTSIVTRDTVLTDTIKTVSGLNNITDYYWRVKAKGSIGWGSFSTGWKFTTIVPVPAAPTLVSPITATLGNPLNLNLIWNKSQYATTYDVVLSTDAGFTSIILEDSTLTDTLKALTNLTPQTIYYWKVRAKNVAGWSSFSSIYNFKTIGTASQVTLYTPANGATGQPNSITFKWLKATDLTMAMYKGNLGRKSENTDEPLAVSNYWFELATDAGFTGIIARDSSLTDTSKAVSGLNNITTYYWRVKAKNQAGWGTFSEVWNFTTIVPLPSIPTLISPVNASTGNPLVLNLLWNKPQYATGYNVILATDAGFTSIVLNDSTLTDSVKALNNLTSLTTYYWKVRAKNAAGWGSFSNAYSFKTVGSATQVVLSSPANGVTGQPVNLTFKWFKAIDQTDGPEAVVYYWYELATDAGFTSIVTRDSLLTDTTKAISGLNNITTYYWRVKAKNQVGWGAFSPIWNFTTIVPASGVPTLISPVYGSTGNPLNLNLVWSKPQYSTQYNVVLATDTGFTSIVLNDTTLTDSVKALTNLNVLTTYYWKVRAKNASGWGLFSSPFNFKTIGVPTQVTLSTPANNATGQPVNLSFKWFKAVDQTLGPLTVSNYWIELATDAGFTTIVAKDTTLTDTTTSVTGLSYITDYFWRVKAKSQIGWGGFSNSFKFTTIVPVSSSPTLVSPLNNSVGNPVNLNLVWNKPQYSNLYNVLVATDAGFTNIFLNDSTLTDSVKAVTDLKSYTTYYWKVRAKNASGWGSFSTTYNFKTIGVPTIVVLSTPANNATGQPTTLTFKWYKAVDQILMSAKNTGKKGKEVTDEPLTVSYYFFEMATDTSFVNIIARDSLLTDTVKTVTGLNSNTLYYWRVKAKNQVGWGDFCSKWQFRTLVPSLSLNLKVYLEGFWDGTTQITDTVNVYLANATTYAFDDTAKVILSSTGTASMVFSKVSTGSYYIVVNHRNHLETWSKLPQSFVGGTPLSYDFTTAMTQAYGDNMKQVGSVWVLFGGDANADGSIDAMDIGIFITEFGNLGYLRSDFNGDGDVNAADILIIAQNFGSIKIIPGVEPLSPETIKNLKKEFDKIIKSGKDIKKIVSDKKNAVNDKKKSVNN